MKNKEIKKFYKKEEVAKEYDNNRFTTYGGRLIMTKDLNRLRSTLNGHKGKLLDIATGTGRFAIEAASLGFSVTAFDYSQEMLNELKKKKGDYDIKLVQGDAAELPFENNSFDVVISFRFFWHYANFEPFLNEALRVCKKDGIVVFDLLNRNSLRRFVEFFASMRVYSSLSTQQSIQKIVNENGATINKFEWDYFFPYVIYRKLPKIFVILLNRFENLFQKTPLRKSSTVMYIHAQSNDAEK